MGGRYVRMCELHTLPWQERVAALTTSMRELAIAQSFLIIHGKERAYDQFEKTRTAVRFDGDGEPMVWVERTSDNA